MFCFTLTLPAVDQPALFPVVFLPHHVKELVRCANYRMLLALARFVTPWAAINMPQRHIKHSLGTSPSEPSQDTPKGHLISLLQKEQLAVALGNIPAHSLPL